MMPVFSSSRLLSVDNILALSAVVILDAKKTIINARINTNASFFNVLAMSAECMREIRLWEELVGNR